MKKQLLLLLLLLVPLITFGQGRAIDTLSVKVLKSTTIGAHKIYVKDPLYFNDGSILSSATAISSIPYPGAGIPQSTGGAWTTSYGVSGTGSTILLTNGNGSQLTGITPVMIGAQPTLNSASDIQTLRVVSNSSSTSYNAITGTAATGSGGVFTTTGHNPTLNVTSALGDGIYILANSTNVSTGGNIITASSTTVSPYTFVVTGTGIAKSNNDSLMSAANWRAGIYGTRGGGTGGGTVLNGTGLVRATGTTISYDNTTYIGAASPTLTGVPLAPTAAKGTNTNQIATMAAINAATKDSTTLQAALTASPALVLNTPNLGVATATSINGNTITTGTGTLTLGSYSVTAGQSGTLGSNAFSSSAFAPLTSPAFQQAITQQSTSALDATEMGSEMIDATGWTANTGWTGSYAAGYTHTTASGVLTLTRTTTTSNYSAYLVTYVITGRTTGSVVITLGGATSSAISATGTWIAVATGNASLVFTPTTDFNGTIGNISVKSISGGRDAIYTVLDNTGTSNFEIRSDLASRNNVFLGKNTAIWNTTGYDNTVVGVQAGYYNLSGSSLTAVGKYALFNNIGGNQLTSIGVGSLMANTNGSGSTGLGVNALYNNTTGNSNFAGGLQSLVNLTTGSYNTAGGTQSGIGLTVGNYNVVLGYYALNSTNAASNSTAIGSYSLQTATLGGNSALGAHSGHYIADGSTPNTTSTNSVYLGKDTKASADGNTNETVIGYGAIGNGSNTVTLGNTSVVKVVTSGNIIAPHTSMGVTSTVSAATTTVLTVTSTQHQIVTGSASHNFTLPVVSTLTLGYEYIFTNQSINLLVIYSSGSNVVQVLYSGQSARIVCVSLTGTTAASWNSIYIPGANASMYHISTGGFNAIPTIVAGASAGTSPTVSIGANSTDVSGVINITTGTATTVSGILATITYNKAYMGGTNMPVMIIQPNNAATAALYGPGAAWVSSNTLTTAVLSANTTALAVSTAYSWTYHVIQ